MRLKIKDSKKHIEIGYHIEEYDSNATNEIESIVEKWQKNLYLQNLIK